MYTRENYDKVKEMIDARRDGARAKADARAMKLRMLSPEISEIDEELKGTGFLIFKTACEGGDIAPVRARNQALVARRKELIRALGFEEDYAEVKYHCPDCKDTGYIDTKMCSCFRSLLLTENIKSSGMGRLIEKQSFDNFDLTAYDYDPEVRQRMEENLLIAKTYAKHFGKKYKGHNMLLSGKTGTGKTHISTSIAKCIIEQGYDVLYDSVQNVVSAFETDKFKSGYGHHEPIAEKYLECDLLLLDDLGTEYSSQFTVACLYNLINTRQNKGLSTIISTNLTPSELSEKYDDRIYSRIVGSDYIVLLFDGKDYRLFRR